MIELLKCLAIGCLGLFLSSCGPGFGVKNDTQARLYIDTLYVNHPRPLAPQVLEPGSTYSAPRCWRDISDLYLGDQRDGLRRMTFDRLCKPDSCSCTINISQL
jgi:hypothetical protein